MKRYSEKSFLSDASELSHEAYKKACEYYKIKKFTRAKHAFETSLEYLPLDSRAWFALGDCYDELSEPANAEKCFKKSLKYASSEKRSDIFYNLGNSLYDQNKLAEAIECYQEVSSQDGAYESAQKNLKLANNEISINDT